MSDPDPIDMMEQTIATLTRERDEARAEVERLTAALVLITHWRGDLIDHEAGARNPREIAQDALSPDASAGLDCPNCDNSGSYGEPCYDLHGNEDVEHVQCEWCHTTRDSKYNMGTKASTTTSQPATTTRPSGEDVASGGDSEASQ